MRGGYRLGAGRPGQTVKLEYCLRLSVSGLKRHGVLGTAWVGQWAWHASQPGRAQSIVEMRTTAHSVHLSFDSHGRSVQQALMLAQVPNNFGGYRTYLTCPRCTSRRREVYFLDGLFLCRVCHELPYSSKSEDGIDRSWRAERKLELKLGSRYKKPKGMHQATFQRLRKKLFALEFQREELIDAMFHAQELWV